TTAAHTNARHRPLPTPTPIPCPNQRGNLASIADVCRPGPSVAHALTEARGPGERRPSRAEPPGDRGARLEVPQQRRLAVSEVGRLPPVRREELVAGDWMDRREKRDAAAARVTMEVPDRRPAGRRREAVVVERKQRRPAHYGVDARAQPLGASAPGE